MSDQVDPSASRDDVSPAALIGIAVDVSGSMSQSIQNRDGISQSRFASFRQAVSEIVEEGRRKAQELIDDGQEEVAEALVFAYAFGMRYSPQVVDLLSMRQAAENVVSEAEIEQMKRRYAGEIRSRYSGYGGLADTARSFGFGGLVNKVERDVRASAEAEVRRRIESEVIDRVQRRLKEIGDTTMTLTQLADLWAGRSPSFDQAERFIFGGTPMRSCLETVAARFERETPRLPPDTDRFLVLVSDGAPTDGDPMDALLKIKSTGVFVASCFVTDHDVGEAKHVYGTPQENWPPEVRLMFEAASPIGEDEMFGELLEGMGWTVEEGARLFVQANHSESLQEFLSLTFSRTER
jgi:hypothetical protein